MSARVVPTAVEPAPTRPAAGLVLLVEHAARAGVSPATTLAGTGLEPSQLAHGGLQVTAAQELAVVRAVRRMLGEVGSEVGSRYRAATFGALGWAIVSSRTVGDAVDVALRYLDLSHVLTRPRAEVVAGELVGVIEAGHLAPDVRRFLLDRDATAMRVVLESLVPGGVGARLEVEPRRAVLRVDARELERPLVGVDPSARDLAEALCREIVGPRRARSGLTEEVRVLIAQNVTRGAPMPLVASSMGLTERTLRRRLTAEHTAYRELLDEVRGSLAHALLTAPRTMAVGEVAQRLGFSGATSFIAAHRRWTGTTPRHASHAPAVSGAPGVSERDTFRPRGRPSGFIEG